MPHSEWIVNCEESLEVQVQWNCGKIICSHKNIEHLEQKLPRSAKKKIKATIPKKEKTVLTKNQKKKLFKKSFRIFSRDTPEKINIPQKHSQDHRKRMLWKKAKLIIKEADKLAESDKKNISNRK